MNNTFRILMLILALFICMTSCQANESQKEFKISDGNYDDSPLIAKRENENLIVKEDNNSNVLKIKKSGIIENKSLLLTADLFLTKGKNGYKLNEDIERRLQELGFIEGKKSIEEIEECWPDTDCIITTTPFLFSDGDHSIKVSFIEEEQLSKEEKDSGKYKFRDKSSGDNNLWEIEFTSLIDYKNFINSIIKLGFKQGEGGWSYIREYDNGIEYYNWQVDEENLKIILDHEH